MTLPRELTLAPDGTTLLQAFVPELQALRRAHARHAGVAVPAAGVGGALFFGDAAGTQLEITATFRICASTGRHTAGAGSGARSAAMSGSFGLLVLAAPDVSERTVIGFDPERQTVYLDRTASGAAAQSVRN